MNDKYGFIDFLTNLDIVGTVIIAVLLIMSLSAWYVIAAKIFIHVGTKQKSDKFLSDFWHSSSSEQLINTVDKAKNDNHFAKVAIYAFESARHLSQSEIAQDKDPKTYDDFLTRSIRYAVDIERSKLESGMTLLASVGSTAPFVGLFGTVWGIYHALIAIGISGQGTLDKVAGPVGEALIMTACGLGVAIPAVLGYNAFNRINKKVLFNLDGFAYSVYSFLTTGGHPKRTGA